MQDLEAPPILDGMQRQLLVNCSLMARTSATRPQRNPRVFTRSSVEDWHQ